MDQTGLHILARQILRDLSRARNWKSDEDVRVLVEHAYQSYRLLYDELFATLDEDIRACAKDPSESDTINPAVPPTTDEPN